MLADLLGLLCVMFFLCFCHFSICCPGSGVVLDCIDSLRSYLLLLHPLPHTSIKDKLIDLIERIFQREDSPYLACNDLTSEQPENIMHGFAKMYVMH